MATDFDEKEIYIGRRAQELRGLLKIKWPVEHGIVSFSCHTHPRGRSLYQINVTG